jgi:hypothetical protein
MRVSGFGLYTINNTTGITPKKNNVNIRANDEGQFKFLNFKSVPKQYEKALLIILDGF